METTEKIVESCCRYLKQWFTIPNIKCEEQYESTCARSTRHRPRSWGGIMSSAAYPFRDHIRN
jgi:hypothetical protein